MSNSPLAGAMAQTQEPAKKKKKRGGALLMVSGLALVASLGGVFASNTITINSGTVEFGAGTATTTACDTGLTAALNQAWDNTAGATGERFEATNVVISGIAPACNTKTIKITLVGASGAICGVDGATTISTASWSSNAVTLTSGDDGFTVPADGVASGQTGTATLPVAADCASTSVLRIAIATS